MGGAIFRQKPALFQAPYLEGPISEGFSICYLILTFSAVDRTKTGERGILLLHVPPKSRIQPPSWQAVQYYVLLHGLIQIRECGYDFAADRIDENHDSHDDGCGNDTVFHRGHRGPIVPVLPYPKTDPVPNFHLLILPHESF